MTIEPAVKKETRAIAMGVGIMALMMIAVFLIINQFNHTVILGALLGSLAAVANFFLMALTVQRITAQIHGVKKQRPEAEAKETDPSADEKALEIELDEEDPLTPEEEAELKEMTRQAKIRMQRSYALRMVMLIGVAVLAIKVDIFHSVAALVPMLFPRIIIMVKTLTVKLKGA